MPSGTLEVFLGNAKGLEDQNWLTSMNPYVILTCRTQEKESGVASGEGTDPEWNETFVFTISSDVEEITVRIMDKDTLGSDDFVGEATRVLIEEVMKKNTVDVESHVMTPEDLMKKNMVVDVENHVMTPEDLMKKNIMDVESHVMTQEDLMKNNMVDVDDQVIAVEEVMKTTMVDIENHVMTINSRSLSRLVNPNLSWMEIIL
ncbi:hypothetical protein KY284_005117 [Solanum tuberosum]|nr:hypothetical protein KY284_005117 [Solanum tuberosum]